MSFGLRLQHKWIEEMTMSHPAGLLRIALVTALCTFGTGAAFAQSAVDGCTLKPVVGTVRQTLQCGPGISIVAERGARFQFSDHNGDGKADSVALNGKALLLDVDSNIVKGGFDVETPQAIAAVRGTRWVVDVYNGKTSVLVLRGRVSVRRPDARSGVSLGRGQGVDVAAGSGPLRLTRWPAKRVNALMARLGQ